MSDPNKIVRLVDISAIEAQAADWVARLDHDGVTADDQAQFEAWKAQTSHHREAAERLMMLWSEFDILGGLTTPVSDTSPPRRRTRGGTQKPETSSRVVAGRRVVVASGLAAAASIVLALGVTTMLASLPKTEVYDTAIGGQRTVNLEDGSSVQLNTNSRIEVRYSAKARDLRLIKGEAFFEVAPNKARPFSVYANDGVVRAVGTAFVVRLRGEQIEVTVTKGTVELASLTGSAKPVSLAVVQTVPRKILTQVSAVRGAVETALVDQEQVLTHLDLAPPEATRKLAWRQGMLVFAGESLPSVVADVSRYTDVQIQIADPSLNNLKIGGYFKVGEVEPMLDALETSFGVRVEHIDSKHIKLSAAF